MSTPIFMFFENFFEGSETVAWDGVNVVQLYCEVISMAENSKLKLLYILDIMRKTDEFHPINSTQIASKLSAYGIHAERKSIGRDLACLEDAGYSIIKCADHNKGWYMTDQTFEDFELKILCDAVGAAPFLTDKDSRDLIKKVRDLATAEGEKLISAATYQDTTIKTDDKRNKIKIDTVTRAIKAKKKITFQYYEDAPGNKRRLRRDGHVYCVSPYYLVLYENQYYLICNSDTNDGLTHFRLEMLTGVAVTEQDARNPETIPIHGTDFDLGAYLRRSQNMWSGDQVQVKLRCDNYIRDIIRMRFGKHVMMIDDGPEHFTVTVEVADNTGLYQWLAERGTRLTVLSPESVRNHYLAYLRNIIGMYE